MNTELHQKLVAACDVYVALRKYDQALENLRQDKANVQKYYEQERKKGIKIGGGMTWSIILSAVLCTALIVAATLWVGETATGDQSIATLALLGSILLIPSPVFVGLFYKRVVGGHKEKAFKKKMEALYKDEITPALQQYTAAITKLTAERGAFLRETKRLLDFVPEHYRTNLAVAFMERAVRTGRADTLKEALNLYEEQLHRWNMESYAQSMAEQAAWEAAMMDEHLSRMEANQARMASSLRNIENMEFYNTFCR